MVNESSEDRTFKKVYVCHECQEHHETEEEALGCCEVEPQYKCPKCDELHSSPEDAFDCCNGYDGQVYVCSKCNKIHDYEREARECCKPEVMYVCEMCGWKYLSEAKAVECCKDRKAHPFQFPPANLKTGWGECDVRCRFYKGFANCSMDFNYCSYLDYAWDKKKDENPPKCPYEPEGLKWSSFKSSPSKSDELKL